MSTRLCASVFLYFSTKISLVSFCMSHTALQILGQIHFGTNAFSFAHFELLEHSTSSRCEWSVDFFFCKTHVNKVYISVKGVSTTNVFDNHSNRGRFHSSLHCVDVANADQEEEPHATAVFAIFSSSSAFLQRTPPCIAFTYSSHAPSAPW